MKQPATATISTAPISLETGWSCCAQVPDTITHPIQLPGDAAEWFAVTVPGTVASALRDLGRWNFDQPENLDASDWWFRRTFSIDSHELSEQCTLCLDGLATFAEVWLNGESILTSDNMFRSHRVDISTKLQCENELVIVFRSLEKYLQVKRPRPRWKTNLVSHQQLRWVRATLLGHIPGWSPPVPAIGPWRAIRIESEPVQLSQRQIQTEVSGSTGIVRVQATLLTQQSLLNAELRVGSHVAPLNVQQCTEGFILSGELHIADVPLWWPHTHGDPNLLPCEIRVTTDHQTDSFPYPAVGFRKLEVNTAEVDTARDGFGLRINDVPVFCRGACWTVSDIFTLHGSSESLAHDLRLARDAGMNMLRLGGTMAYESDEFYSLCDQLGILVWQDFAFANMDYPVQDPAFRENIRRESTELLQRLAGHPAVVVYCGNSEIEQQAAMLGMPRELWTNDWFTDELPSLCADHHPGTAYVPSTPTGGALPFQPRVGLTHYYGVGAYRRTLDDVRRADVKFTPECLGFSHLPERSTMEQITSVANPVMHAPQWKRRVPRDTGAGWDFEDVRDHYLQQRFGVDPVALRSWNMPRYLQLSRIVTGEMMSQVFSEWRSCHSHNRGALVWFYKDLWPAAGWGIVDSNGLPKAVYYALKRTWSSRQLTLTEEGLNGLHIHLTNETHSAVNGYLQLQLLREPNLIIADAEVSVTMPAQSQRMWTSDELLDRFCDVTYAYRFGPPQHDVVLVSWLDEQRQPISDAFHFIQPRDPVPTRKIQVEASAQAQPEGQVLMHIKSDSFLYGVHVQAAGYLPCDNDFHLGPQRTKEVMFRPLSATPPAFHAELEALNLGDSLFISTSPSP